MSTKTVEGGLLAAARSDCVMVTYNMDYRDEAEVLDEVEVIDDPGDLDVIQEIMKIPEP